MITPAHSGMVSLRNGISLKNTGQQH